MSLCPVRRQRPATYWEPRQAPARPTRRVGDSRRRARALSRLSASRARAAVRGTAGKGHRCRGYPRCGRTGIRRRGSADAHRSYGARGVSHDQDLGAGPRSTRAGYRAPVSAPSAPSTGRCARARAGSPVVGGFVGVRATVRLGLDDVTHDDRLAPVRDRGAARRSCAFGSLGPGRRWGLRVRRTRRRGVPRSGPAVPGRDADTPSSARSGCPASGRSAIS